MTETQLDKIREFVSENIGEFHAQRLEHLRKLKLDEVLQRRNPYLCKAKNLEIAHEFVKSVADDYLTQGERTLFGNFLEDLALFVGGELCGGQKSSAEGVDLEFTRDGCRYIVSVKSGPNWGNSSAVKRQRESFRRAVQVVRQSRKWKSGQVQPVLGCCFGRPAHKDHGDHIKICGQAFWHLLSGDDGLYVDLIAPLGHEAKKRNRRFQDAYAQLLNKMTQEFSQRFCKDGRIQWEDVVKLSSARERPRPPRPPKPSRKPKRARKKG